MALTVNTNISSLNAQRNLSMSSKNLSVAFERLSSGLRINSAKDDAAGLAITQGMTAQIQALSVTERNANNGISVIQTAEGSLNEVSNNLLRIRELSVQAANADNTASDRAKLQDEVKALKNEIDRIAGSVDFNGTKLLDGSYGTATFQVGTRAGDEIGLSISSAKTAQLGTANATQTGQFTLAKKTTTAGSFSTTGSLAALSAGQMTINGVSIRAASSGDDVLSSSDNAASSFARAAAINASADQTGVRAVANATTLALGAVTVGTTTTVVATGDDFQINGTNVALTNAASLTQIITDINAQSATTGVTASGSAGAFTLTATDGRNIRLTSSGDVTVALFANFDVSDALDKVQSGTVTLYSNKDIVIGGTSPATAGTGLEAQTISATTEKVLQATGTGFQAMSTGDLIINGFSVNMSAITVTSSNERSSSNGTASAQRTALMINNTTGLKDQVVATARTEMNLGKVTAAAAGNLVLNINGTAVTINQEITENDGNGFLAGKINATLNTGSTTDDINGIVASVNSDGELILTASDGRNIRANVGTANATSFLGNIDVTTTNTDVLAKGSITLAAKDGYAVAPIEGNKQALAGIVDQRGTVASVDVSTLEGAKAAITAVDSALDQINSQRAVLGATQNRFDSSVRVMQNVSQNLQAARSRIRDVDFSQETGELTKNQILQQAGVSILAQANASPQRTVLALLQGG